MHTQRDVVHFMNVGEKNDELIAAQSNYGIDLTDAMRETLGHDDQQLIACFMAHAVVNQLELVQIEKSHGQFGAITISKIHALLQSVVEHVAIGQASQTVMRGLMLNLLFITFALGNVLYSTFVIEKISCLVMHHTSIFRNPDGAFILAIHKRLKIVHAAMLCHCLHKLVTSFRRHIKLMLNVIQGVHQVIW